LCMILQSPEGRKEEKEITARSKPNTERGRCMAKGFYFPGRKVR
jgi:hypothetical protein